MSKKLFELEQHMSRQQISNHLREIAEGLEKGSIELGSGNQSIELNPSENPEFEIKVEKEADNEKSLELEIEWKEGEEPENLEIG